jgi:hypothetical protein
MDITKVIRLETIQNKQQLVLGAAEYDLVLKSKGKIAVQVGSTFSDVTRTLLNDPLIPRIFPISSKDFITNVFSYTYEIDMRNFDCIVCNWKLSQLDTTAIKYTINLKLLSAYPYKMNSIHFNIINDSGTDSLIPIEVNFTNIDGENNFGFEEMPIIISLTADQKVRSRFMIFYYDSELKYWFNPLY